jgi:hypothetical protein
MLNLLIIVAKGGWDLTRRLKGLYKLTVRSLRLKQLTVPFTLGHLLYRQTGVQLLFKMQLL